MGRTRRMLRMLRGGSAVFLIVAAGALVASGAMDTGLPRDLMISAASALATVFFALHVLIWAGDGRERRLRLGTVDVARLDPAPVVLTDDEGTILARNPAAAERLGAPEGASIARALDAVAASPDAVVQRLRATAGAGASAHEDVAAVDGQVRVTVHPAPGGLLWRVETLPTRPARIAGSVEMPLLTVGPSGAVLFMNDPLRAAAGQRVRRLRDLFETVPLESGGINEMTTRDGTMRVRTILSAQGDDGRQDVFVLPAGDARSGRAGLDDLPVALLRLDSAGQVLFANRLARELLPAIAEGSELRFAAMVEGLGRSVKDWIAEAAAGRGLYRPEVVRVTGAEVETYLQVTFGRPVDDPDGGLVAVLSDATELKTLEAQFVQSQKMQAIGQLAGGVAHDFNNLLTAISGHCDLILLRHDESDEDYADLTQITHNANRAAALVGQLLAFSRKQTLEMRPIDVRDALGDLAHLLNRLVGERVTLRLDHDPALDPIRGDRRQLEQVLMNLVVNARDAMPDGGEVLIATRSRYLDAPMVRDRVTVPAGQYVVIEVSDEGHGITPDNLNRIFEPFFTTKRPGEGTGLGLSMAYGIVKQSGGFIFADSAVGGGTVFSLYFPASLHAEPADDGMAATSPRVAALAPVPTIPQPTPRSVTEGHDLDGVVESRPQRGTARRVAAQEPDLVEALALAIAAEPAGGRSRGDVGSAQRGHASDASREDGTRVGSRPGPAGVTPASGERQEPVGVLDQLRAVVEATQRGAAPPAPGHPPAAPTSEAATVSEARVEADGAGGGARPVVLLVEDEAPVRAFASRALRLRGYDVMEAESAEAALDCLSDASLVVDVFVTDVMMPGLDGPTWVRRALETRPDVRTVFISGYTQDALSETSAPVPNAVFLPKPFSLSDLTRTVEKVLQ